MLQQDHFNNSSYMIDYYYDKFSDKNDRPTDRQSKFQFFLKVGDNLFAVLGSGSSFPMDTSNYIPQLSLPEKNTINANEQINDLRKYMGFNISELAKIMRVTRPTIYEWLELKSPDPKNQDRLDFIYSLCKSWKEKGAGKLEQYKYRKITHDNKCLIDLLKEKKINEAQVNKMLDMVAESLLKSMHERATRDESLKSKGFEPISKEEQRSRLMRLTRKIS